MSAGRSRAGCRCRIRPASPSSSPTSPPSPDEVAAGDEIRPVVSPRPAASVVLLRPGPDGPAVLLTHRPPSMAFAPDVHVFPGGAVDPGDADDRLVARS